MGVVGSLLHGVFLLAWLRPIPADMGPQTAPLTAMSMMIAVLGAWRAAVSFPFLAFQVFWFLFCRSGLSFLSFLVWRAGLVCFLFCFFWFAGGVLFVGPL